MTEMRKIIDLLTEMNWHDKSPIIPMLKQHPGKFIHFSHIPKLGINPKKHHADPHGIYFYPTDWLVNAKSDRITRGDQFGVNLSYYFVVSIDFSTPGIILSSFTWDDFNRIAKMNGWDHLWEQVDRYDNGELFLPTANIQSSIEGAKFAKAELTFPAHTQGKLDKAGNMLWAFCELMQNNMIMSWQKSLKNIAYIYDDNNSIIHYLEPHQLLVFDSRVIKIVYSNVHKPPTVKRIPYGEENWNEWKVAVKQIMQLVATKYNGFVKWKDKRPVALFEIDDKKFRLSYYDKWDSCLNLEFIYGRATDYYKVSAEKMQNLTVPEIIDFIDNRVQSIVSLDTDLLFEPVMSPSKVIEISESDFFAEDATVKWTTTISNALNETDNKYAAIRLVGIETQLVDGIKIENTVYIDILQKYLRVSLKTTINDEKISYANNPEEYDYMTVNCINETKKKYWESLNNAEPLWTNMPNDNDRYWRPRFYDHAEWQQFLGWFVDNTNLNIQKNGADTHPYTELKPDYKRSLVDQIKYVIRKF